MRQAEVSPARPTSHVQRLRFVGYALVALGVLKYLVILAEEDFDVSRAPNFFVVLLVPIVIGLAMLPRKVGISIVGLMAAVFLAITVSAIVRLGFEQQNWSDALLVFLGVPISLAGVASAIGALRTPKTDADA